MCIPLDISVSLIAKSNDESYEIDVMGSEAKEVFERDFQNFSLDPRKVKYIQTHINDELFKYGEATVILI